MFVNSELISERATFRHITEVLAISYENETKHQIYGLSGNILQAKIFKLRCIKDYLEKIILLKLSGKEYLV